MMRSAVRTVCVALCLLPALAGAQGLLGGVSADQDFLPPDEAFRFSAAATAGDAAALHWGIADEYYLYRHRLAVKTPTPGVQLGELGVPDGKRKTDEFFGDVEVYYQQLDVVVPIRREAAVSEIELRVTYQGCAEAGLCYPPITKTVSLTLPPPGAVAAGTGPEGGMIAEQDRLAGLISSGNLLIVMATFFGLGILLAFTPCVLPMIPILSGIIAGQGTQATTRRSFLLSLSYVLGMALTYTVAGAAFAAAGQQVQAFFQQTWIIVLFALLFVALALAMFGLYELQVPAGLQSRLAAVSGRQRSGSFAGAFIMGALSALVVTACVAPPLVAALAVIGHSGDVLRGALALFALAFGMGAPLLVVGAAGGRLLPQAGPWMETVKALFGVMFLGVAVWMLERILPGPLTLALWALLAFVGGYYFGAAGRRAGQPMPPGARVMRGAGLFAMLYGAILLIGASAGGHDPLQPLKGLSLPAGRGAAAAPEAAALPFVGVASVEDLDRELAGANGRPVLLDFYADWCVSCKEMEKYTFSDPAVRASLAGFLLLKADVTANSDADQALLRRFGTFGPPTTVLISPDGRECRNFRLVGFVAAEEFRQHLARFAREC